MAKAKKGGRSMQPAVIAAAAALGAAAAGYYFYASKDAQKNRQKAAKWAHDLKGDVLKHAKKLEHIDRQQIVAIVDQAAAMYEKTRSIDRTDLKRAAGELKQHWQQIAAELQKAKATPAKRAAAPKKKAKKRAKSA